MYGRRITLLLIAMLLTGGCYFGAYSSGPFVSEYVPGVSKPEIVVVNSSGNKITLSLRGPSEYKMVIGPYQTESMYVQSGNYKYVATAKHITGTNGRATFELHHRYTWRFYVHGHKHP